MTYLIHYYSSVMKSRLTKITQIYHLPQHNITSFYKNKGSRNYLENDRGNLEVGKERSILEKKIYNDISLVLERKAIIAIQKNRCDDLHFMDLSKCFDTLWTKETINNLYDQ